MEELFWLFRDIEFNKVTPMNFGVGVQVSSNVNCYQHFHFLMNVRFIRMYEMS